MLRLPQMSPSRCAPQIRSDSGHFSGTSPVATTTPACGSAGHQTVGGDGRAEWGAVLRLLMANPPIRGSAGPLHDSLRVALCVALCVALRLSSRHPLRDAHCLAIRLAHAKSN